RVAQVLAEAGHSDIHVVANGWGALPAAFAALLSPQITRVTLKHALTSFHDLAMNADQQWPYATMLTDALRHFDLPDVYAKLEAKQLKQIEPWGAGMA
ncbi:MAG: hypothetical protein RIS79_2575, partial [Verrucomicrobiota bacterium]